MGGEKGQKSKEWADGRRGIRAAFKPQELELTGPKPGREGQECRTDDGRRISGSLPTSETESSGAMPDREGRASVLAS